MDPDKSYWIEPSEETRMENIFLSLSALFLCVVLVILVWKCCSNDSLEDEVLPQQNRVPITPIYAHELEPGIIVLQSQDGTYFRILQEYDSVKHKPGNVCTSGDQSNSPGACAETVHPIQHSVIQYIPQYTRPHYQTRPTAPPVVAENLIDIEVHDTPPPYTRH
uniref:Uncharacterized protein n=1 Tax=Pinctada fucata TaxID=50426 RepID=A0A194AM44_PINFU